MAAVRPESNDTHDLGTETHKWSTVHTVDVQTQSMTATGNVTVQGNLTVEGTSTTLDVSTVTVEDPLLRLAKGNNADSVDIGFYGQVVDGEVTKYVGLYRDSTDGKFKFFEDATSEPTTNEVTGGSASTVVADIEGDLTGNADTATSASALTTARTLSISGDATGSVSFDGSADADIALTISAGSVENAMLANDGITFGDGTNSEELVLGSTLEIGGTTNEVDVTYSLANNKFTVGLPDDVTIAGDLQVNGTINATIEGVSDESLKWQTARTITLGGDLGGSVSIDGSADATLTATIQSGSVENTMLANDGITLKLGGTTQEDINLGDDLNFAGTANEVEVAYDSASNTLTFGLPNSITASLTGNASTASAWQTARTLSLGGDLGGSVSIDGSSDATLTATIQAGSVENSMLANNTMTISDGSASSNIALGDTHTIQGTANEVTVSHASGTTTVGLPATISGLSSVTSTSFSGDLTGNADTASALETARTLSVSGDASGSVSFDGSANADIALTISAGSVENTMLANDGISLKLSGVDQEDINLGDSLDFAGTASEVEVAYDSTNNRLTFGLPNSITASLSGNSTTASAWQTARTISLGGDLGGSVSIDGSANATLTATIQADSVENSMLLNEGISLKLDGTLQEDINLGDSLDFVSGQDIDLTYNANTNALTVALEDEIDSDTTGNAATASAWENARTLSLGGDLGGSVSIDGSANATLTATIQASSVENSMLANDGIGLKLDGTLQEDINLGDDLDFVSGQDIDLSYNSTTNALTIALESEIDSDTTGNAATASAWENARTLSLGGDLGGSVSIDGSADATLTATIQAGSVDNSMLANDGITVGDGTNSEEIQLGQSLEIGGTTNEVDVAYDTTNNKFTVGLPDDVTIAGDLQVNGTINATIEGVSDEAVKWQTARTISLGGDLGGSVSIDGSADATLTATIQSGSVENSMLVNDGISFTDGTNSEELVLGSTLEIGGTTNEVEVAYDTTNNKFTVGLPSSINADTTGNSATASALETARTLSLSGDVTGSGSFDGSGDLTISTTLAGGTALTFADGAGTSESLDLGSTITFSGTTNEVDVSYATATNTFTVGLPSSINADTTGNSATASALETARTLSLSGDVTGSGSFDGSGDLTISTSLAGGTAFTFSDGTNSEALDIGATIEFGGTSNQVDVAYSTTNDKFTISLPSTINVDTTGNAGTATALETARNFEIGSGPVRASAVSFDATGNVSLTSSIANSQITNAMLSNSTIAVSDGSVSSPISLGGGFTIGGTSNEVEVSQSGGAFTVGLPSSVSVNASTASAWETARTLSLGGDLGGSVSIDGSADATLTATIQAGSVENSMLANDGISLKVNGVDKEDINLGDSLDFVSTTNETTLDYNASANSLTFGLPSTINANTTGNAGTATALETARTFSIGSGPVQATGVSFDGSGNVSLTSTIGSNQISNAMIANSYISVDDNVSNPFELSLGQSLTIGGTANEVEVSQSGGVFSIGLPSSISTDLSGNASTASAWENPRTITLGGDLGGSVSIDGSADATLTATIQNGSVDNAMLANDGISLLVDSVSQEDINLGDSLNFVSGQDLDISYNTTTNQLSFALESEIDSDTTGNAATASSWQNPRTLNLGGDLGGSVSIDGSADATLTATIQAGSVENSMLANSTVTLSADSGSNDPVSLGETITISGTSNEIETATAGSNQVTIGLPNNVTVANNLTVSNDLTVSSGDVELTDGTLSILGGGASISGTVTINGTHTINGSLVANSATMKFQDNILELGYLNSSVVDHGWHSKHSDSEYVGNVYDESASEFIFFKTDTKPTTTVDTTANGFSEANLRVNALHALGELKADDALINNAGHVAFHKLSFESISGTSTTISASQLRSGVVVRDAPGNKVDSTATAAQIVASFPSSMRTADSVYETKLIVENTDNGYELTAGSGVTLVGGFSSLADGMYNLLVRITNATSSSEAVTIYLQKH